MNKIIFIFITTMPLFSFAEYGKLDKIPFSTETQKQTEFKIELRTEKQKPQKARLEKLQSKEQETGIRELRGKK